MSVYPNSKVYGPYLRRDGRKHVVLVFPDLTKKTVSYPRYLVEMSIGRQLQDIEDIHHKDGDFTNNCLDNLEIVAVSKHRSGHAKKYFPREVSCIWCRKTFMQTAKQHRNCEDNRRRGKKGPFCSRKCSGQYGVHIQKGA